MSNRPNIIDITTSFSNLSFNPNRGWGVNSPGTPKQPQKQPQKQLQHPPNPPPHQPTNPPSSKPASQPHTYRRRRIPPNTMTTTIFLHQRHSSAVDSGATHLPQISSKPRSKPNAAFFTITSSSTRTPTHLTTPFNIFIPTLPTTPPPPITPHFTNNGGERTYPLRGYDIITPEKSAHKAYNSGVVKGVISARTDAGGHGDGKVRLQREVLRKERVEFSGNALNKEEERAMGLEGAWTAGVREGWGAEMERKLTGAGMYR